MIQVFWTATGTTNAPAAGGYQDGTVGAASDGATAGLTYHVVTTATGAKTWVATGGTVANYYGG